MAHRSDQRATTEPITDIVLLADLIDLQQYIKHTKLLAAQQRTIGIKTGTEIILIHKAVFLIPQAMTRSMVGTGI